MRLVSQAHLALCGLGRGLSITGVRRWAAQPCLIGGSAAAAHATHAAVSFVFCTAKLPPHLQREFDAEANQRTLRHLMSRAQERCATSGRRTACRGTPCVSGKKAEALCGNVVALEVLPDWAHLVSWQCATCHARWTARPVDRLDRQVQGAHSCPRCRARRVRLADGGADARTSLATSAVGDAVPQKNNNNKQTGGSVLLAAHYPALAAQWDVARNLLPQNRVTETLKTAEVSSASLVWWRCLHCRRAWRESVCGCVARCEAQQGEAQKSKPGTSPPKKEADWLVLCPSCAARGAARRCAASGGDDGNAVATSLHSARVLADDAMLMSEVRLQPHQDPCAISLQSETRLSWRCRYCQYDFQASVADRYMRYARCPRCAGQVCSILNLLTIQRPDVVHEVADSVAPQLLSHLTVAADNELPFVCRVCLSPYRMSVRTRCTLPPGAVACPKCLLAQTHVARSAAMQATQPLSRRQWRKVRESARQVSRATRSRPRFELVRSDACSRDRALYN